MCASRQRLGGRSWRHLKPAQDPALVSWSSMCYCCKTPMSRWCKDLLCPTSLCPLHPGGWICGEPFPAAGGRMQEWRGNKRNKTQRVVGRCAEHRDNWVHYTSKGCIHGCNGGLIKIQLYSYFFPRRYSFWSCWREVRKCKGLVKRKNDQGAPLLFGKSD